MVELIVSNAVSNTQVGVTWTVSLLDVKGQVAKSSSHL
jgi:hypothetical protein